MSVYLNEKAMLVFPPVFLTSFISKASPNWSCWLTTSKLWFGPAWKVMLVQVGLFSKF